MIPKGGCDAVRDAGIEQFRAGVRHAHPGFAAQRDEEVRDWDDVKLPDVRIDRLRHWYAPGLLCIKDAAHAMSPAGGVRINLGRCRTPSPRRGYSTRCCEPGAPRGRHICGPSSVAANCR
ncbi:hypothetical protein ABT373_33395 [Streptomyces sp. NPDC000070]|uniref:hypothetical protein n=1 Tax=Streptomyces sp. NPDC000070 TaxID=3154240 RepID=UPI00332FD6F4